MGNNKCDTNSKVAMPSHWACQEDIKIHYYMLICLFFCRGQSTKFNFKRPGSLLQPPKAPARSTTSLKSTDVNTISSHRHSSNTTQGSSRSAPPCRALDSDNSDCDDDDDIQFVAEHQRSPTIPPPSVKAPDISNFKVTTIHSDYQ